MFREIVLNHGAHCAGAAGEQEGVVPPGRLQHLGRGGGGGLGGAAGGGEHDQVRGVVLSTMQCDIKEAVVLI